MTNNLITQLLDQYKVTYDGKYWNKGYQYNSQYSINDWGVTASTTGTGNMYGNAYECYGFLS